MELRTDFARREVVRPDGEALWLSPMAWAERYVLDRIGEEVARETAIVRYAAGARLSAHTHRGGEEFLVLAGSFHDDAGDYFGGHLRAQPDRNGARAVGRSRRRGAVCQAAPVHSGRYPARGD